MVTVIQRQKNSSPSQLKQQPTNRIQEQRLKTLRAALRTSCPTFSSEAALHQHPPRFRPQSQTTCLTNLDHIRAALTLLQAPVTHQALEAKQSPKAQSQALHNQSQAAVLV